MNAGVNCTFHLFIVKQCLEFEHQVAEDHGQGEILERSGAGDNLVVFTFWRLPSNTRRDPAAPFQPGWIVGAVVDQNSVLWYTFSTPEWRNRQTRATQNRVGLAHVGSIPTSGIWFNQG